MFIRDPVLAQGTLYGLDLWRRTALKGCGEGSGECRLRLDPAAPSSDPRPSMPLLTRDLIPRAFDGMGTEAARRGLVAEIAVYRGSCIMLASDIRQATGDVDAVS